MISLHLLHPWWLLALLPLAGILFYLRQSHRPEKHWQDICDPQLLPHLLINNGAQQQTWPILLLATAWFCTIIALTGPCFSRQALPIYQQQDPLVIALDTSLDMLATDVTPDRATRAKYKVLDLLKHRQQGQTAMLAFSNMPFVITPLTNDSNTIATMMPDLSPNMMPSDGHNISAALQQAHALLKQAGVARGKILLISSNKAHKQDVAIAKKLAQLGFITSVLAIGTAQGSPIATNNGFLHDKQDNLRLATTDATSLKTLAHAGGGRFANFSNSDQDIQHLLEHAHIAKPMQSSQTTTQWLDQGYIFIWLLLPLVLLLFRGGWFDALLNPE